MLRQKLHITMLILLSLSYILTINQILGQSASAGTTTANFLSVNPDARISAMGESTVAVIDDADSLTWNPAVLGLTKHREVSLSTMTFNGTSGDILEGSRLLNFNAIYAMPYGSIFGGLFDSLGTFGLSLIYADQGDVPRTGADSPDIIGSFKPSNFAGSLLWGNKITNHSFLGNIPFGIGVKFIQQNIYNYSSSGIAFDFGFAYVFPNTSPLDGLTLASSILNLGSVSAFISQTDPLPLTVKVGAAYSFYLKSLMKWLGPGKMLNAFKRDALLSLDVTKSLDNTYVIRTGAELFFFEIISLRMGYQFREESRAFSLGMGFAISNAKSRYEIDLAWVPQSVLGDTFRITVNYLWDTKNYLRKNRIKETILDDFSDE